MTGHILTSPADLQDLLAPSVFLAGGISNCPDWQTPAGEYLHAMLPDHVIVNPRRNNWDMTDSTASEKQIRWEHRHLAFSNAVLFWFPQETLCPITLLELGKFLMQPDVPLFVGTHPQYQRRFDVVVQTQLERPDVRVHDDFAELLAETAGVLAR